jgi:hypothetical protein
VSFTAGGRQVRVAFERLYDASEACSLVYVAL